MKQFKYRHFKEARFTIPNSDADLVISAVRVPNPYSWSTENLVNGKEISYKGHKIISFVPYHSYGRTVEFIHDNAIELGLIVRDSGNILDAIIDALYYIYNPAKYTKHAGLIKVETIKAIFSRLEGGDLAHNRTTKLMLDVLETALKDRAIQLGNTQGTYEYNLAISKELQAIGIWKRYKNCIFTGRFAHNGYFKESKYRNETIAWDLNNITLAKLGLKYQDGFIYAEHQYVWNKKIWNTEDGSITCPCCKDKVPKLAYNKETKECEKCETRHFEIHSYSTRVPQLLKFKAHKVKPETLYLGCELEFETTDKDTARIKVGKALKGHAIMKSDGSIRNGFEVVTCPATIDIHMEEFKKFYSDLPGELRNASNVGMHVHVSRKPLSILTVGKLTAFMNRGDNKTFIEYVAGRRNNTYCHQGSRSVTYPWTNQSGGERYNTLNLCNKETIEFRIFSTPLTFQEFASKIQFCQALVDYCKPANLSLSLKEMTHFQNFINWVLPRKKEYPQLVETLKGFA